LTPEQRELLNGDALHIMIFRRLERMLDNPDEHGIYPTTEFMVGLKGDILRWVRQDAEGISKTMARVNLLGAAMDIVRMDIGDTPPGSNDDDYFMVAEQRLLAAAKQLVAAHADG
jgi:hypothetical protein